MANIYVNHTGSSTPPYDTEAKAARNIQVALDAAVSGDTVLIKADQNYIMNGTDQQAAQFDVDVNDNVTIRGYYTTVGDQDYGGTYYKDPNHGLVVIDANNGAFHIFSAGDKSALHWYNLKTINVNTGYNVYSLILTTEKFGYLLQNCVTTGGKRAIYAAYLGNPTIRDCIFTGTYVTSPPTFGAIYLASSCTRGAIIQDCNFSHGNTTRSIYCLNLGMNIIEHNIFNITGAVTSVIEIAGAAGFLVNNVIYEGTGGSIANGIKVTSETQNVLIYGNIIVGCTTSIDGTTTISLGGWNCFYNNGSNWTLRNGDIVADPQFMNAANGDFRLKPTSPCLNRGKPTLGGGYTDIGAWQRKSFLRWK
jgi:hypothetical protein